MFKLYLVNILALVFTLGLATPWALLRTLKYRADNLLVFAGEKQLSSCVASDEEVEGHIAEAATDLWDLDIGLW